MDCGFSQLIEHKGTYSLPASHGSKLGVMSRELIYQFLLSVALFKFAFSSCYTQLCFRVCLKRLGIIQSLYFLAIGLGQLHYAALRGVTLRCRIGSSHRTKMITPPIPLVVFAISPCRRV